MSRIYRSKTVELTDNPRVYLPVSEDSYEGLSEMLAVGAPSYSISGTASVPGATVYYTLTTTQPPPTGTAIADSNGHFSFPAVNGTYLLRPEYPGVIFDPPTTLVVLSGASVTGVVLGTNINPVPVKSNGYSPYGAYRSIPYSTGRDYLHLKNSSGIIVSWVDINGLLGGNLSGVNAALPIVGASLEIQGSSSEDFMQFVDQKNNVVAWIDPDGVFYTRGSGQPKQTAKRTYVGNPNLDFMQTLDINGTVIGWIDCTGAIGGTF